MFPSTCFVFVFTCFNCLNIFSLFISFIYIYIYIFIYLYTLWENAEYFNIKAGGIKLDFM